MRGCLLHSVRSFRIETKLLKPGDVRGVLGEEAVASVENLVQGHLPPKVPTPSPPSPTEEERMERHAVLLRKRRAVEKRIQEGKEKVEKAGARVVEEKGRLAGVEVEMAELVERIRVLTEENERKLNGPGSRGVWRWKRVRKRKRKWKKGRKGRRSWKVARDVRLSGKGGSPEPEVLKALILIS